MLSECTVHSCLSSRECKSKHLSVVLLGKLVCSFTLQTASCCHQDELKIKLLHGGAFLWNATSCTGAVEVGCAQLSAQTCLIFPVSSGSAAAFLCWKVAIRPLPQRMETKGSEIFFLPQRHYLVWCLYSQRRRIFCLSVSSHVPGRKRGPGGRSWSVTHSLSTLLLN